jgi:RNA polymerase sigma-70 factor (ECF subfamily)
MFSLPRSAERKTADQDKQELTFHQLIEHARHGEAEALSKLYGRFLPGVFGYIASRVPDRFVAEDLTSEVFLEMVEGIAKVRANDEPQFSAWLFRIARIVVAGYYRKHEHVPISVSLEPMLMEDLKEAHVFSANDPDGDPVRWSEARDEWNVVVQAINTLTEDQRQVLVGRLILGYDVATVAQMLGKKDNAIRALQFRALKSLYGLLRQRNIPEEMFHSSVQQEDVQ